MKIGILGFGRAGRRHSLILTQLGVEYCFYDPALAGSTNRDDLLADSNAIIVATPSERHLRDLRDCVHMGKPCLVEKPLALMGQSIEVESVLKSAEERHLLIAVGFNLRFNRAVKMLRQADLNTYFATFVCCQAPKRNTTYINGCLNEWACHEIDIARHLLGPLTLWSAQIAPLNVELQFHTARCHVHVHSDMRAESPVRYATVISEEQSLHVDIEYEFPVREDDYLKQMVAFLNSIEKGVAIPPLASGKDGLAVLKLCEMAAAR